MRCLFGFLSLCLVAASASAEEEMVADGAAFVHHLKLSKTLSRSTENVVAELQSNCAVPGPVQRLYENSERTVYAMSCNSTEQAGDIETGSWVRYTVILAADNEVVDAQKIRVSLNSGKEIPEPLSLNQETVRRVVFGTVAIGTSSMVSQWTAQAFFPGEIDKGRHAVAGALLGAVVTAVSREKLGSTKTQAFLHGLAAAAAAGILKEIWDKNGHGHYEKRDVYATALGGAVGAAGWLVFEVEY